MVRLPHPELAGLVEEVKRHVVGRRVASIAGTEVPYSVFRSGQESPDVAFYDEGGAIYVLEDKPRKGDLLRVVTEHRL